MAWKNREPIREEFDTDEDFQEALAIYEWNEEIYITECEERGMERRNK